MTKIKICGCRTPADIQHAAEAGADFVGMVVAENTKRYVPTEDRSPLVEAARDFDIPLVCVLRDNPKPKDQSEAEHWYPGDMVQWHGQRRRQLAIGRLSSFDPSGLWSQGSACNMPDSLAGTSFWTTISQVLDMLLTGALWRAAAFLKNGSLLAD